MPANPEVTSFLDALVHPLRIEIELLRSIILETEKGIVENIKWNGPNYTFSGADRITMRVQPPKQIQLIFHRGAKKQEQPKGRLIADPFGILDWKENDRAVVGFRSESEIIAHRENISVLIRAWIKS